MPVVNTDAALWYNVGVFGREGYAVPNPSNDPGTLNMQIADIVALMGSNLFAIMHHEDTASRRPPSINTLTRIHRLYVRSGQILGGRAVPPGELRMETAHVQPAGEIFRVFPSPYFLVRNPFLKRWAGLIMAGISEAMQHTENANAMAISTDFAGLVGQYIKAVYQNMAIELFNKTRDVAMADGFLLTPEDLAGYNPAEYFTRTEMVDTVPRLDRRFTEDQLAPLREGILVTSLPELQPWPSNLQALYQSIRSDDVNADDDAFVSEETPEGSEGTGGNISGRQQPIVPPAPPV